jgi:hypothetical protein
VVPPPDYLWADEFVCPECRQQDRAADAIRHCCRSGRPFRPDLTDGPIPRSATVGKVVGKGAVLRNLLMIPIVSGGHSVRLGGVGQAQAPPRKKQATSLVASAVRRPGRTNHPAVNRLVVGSNPTRGANYIKHLAVKVKPQSSSWAALWAAK